jgi:hypothetical protein
MNDYKNYNIRGWWRLIRLARFTFTWFIFYNLIRIPIEEVFR